MKKLGLLIAILLTFGCSSVNIRTDQGREEGRPPTFQKRYVFWWWGLRGEHSVNVREVCVGKPVIQMQVVDTIPDAFYTLITLGIFSPRTARIWCGEAKV